MLFGVKYLIILSKYFIMFKHWVIDNSQNTLRKLVKIDVECFDLILWFVLVL